MHVLYSNSRIFVIPVYIFNGRKQALDDTSGYCQRCACVVCMTSASCWPNCVSRVARIVKWNDSLWWPTIKLLNSLLHVFNVCLTNAHVRFSSVASSNVRSQLQKKCHVIRSAYNNNNVPFLYMYSTYITSNWHLYALEALLSQL